MELLPEAIRGDNAGENKSLAKRRKLLWAECAGTCTLVDNLVTGTNGVPPPCQLFYGMAPKFGKTLRTFGEIGIVAEGTDKKIRAKLTDRGRPCLFLGYAPDHAGDVYRMLNLDTNKAITTRDVYWLNKSYGEYKESKLLMWCESPQTPTMMIQWDLTGLQLQVRNCRPKTKRRRK